MNTIEDLLSNVFNLLEQWSELAPNECIQMASTEVDHEPYITYQITCCGVHFYKSLIDRYSVPVYLMYLEHAVREAIEKRGLNYEQDSGLEDNVRYYNAMVKIRYTWHECNERPNAAEALLGAYVEALIRLKRLAAL